MHGRASLPGLTDDQLIVRWAERRDVPGVLDLWGAARSEHARIEDRADPHDEEIGRRVRNI